MLLGQVLRERPVPVELPFVIFITVVPVLRRAAAENNGVTE